MGRCSDAKIRLLQVAFDLIWQHSYGSVSVDSICERAEVNKGSFYHFFPSKSDLACAAYEEHWQQSRPHYDRLFSPMVPPLERIENYCNFCYELQRERFDKTGRVLGCPFASVAAEQSTQDEKIRHKADEMFERKCRYIENALRDAHKEGLIDECDFAMKAHAIVCLVVGVLLRARTKNDPEVIRLLAPNVLQMIGARMPATESSVSA